MTGVMIVSGFALPLSLAHSEVIAPTACWMSIAGGGLVYGTSKLPTGACCHGSLAHNRLCSLDLLRILYRVGRLLMPFLFIICTQLRTFKRTGINWAGHWKGGSCLFQFLFAFAFEISLLGIRDGRDIVALGIDPFELP